MEDALARGPSLKAQIKKIFDDTLNVKISAGEQFIAPSYNHDRCERSVQMRLYTLNKEQFTVVFFLFFAALLFFVLIGLAGPPITTTRSDSVYTLTGSNHTDLNKGPFLITTPRLSAYCQQLWVAAEMKLEKQEAAFQLTFDVAVEVRGLKDGKSQIMTRANRTHRLSCQGKFKSYNPAFSQLEIWFRFIFVLLSFGASVWFYQTLKSFPMLHWAMEQKWMGLLLPLLLLYNSKLYPLFPLIFVTSGLFASVADGFFQATFLCALMLFWLCIYHGIRQSSRYFLTFYVPKLVLVGSLWFSIVVLTFWDRINERSDITWYSNDLGTDNFKGLKVFFYITGSLYLIYLLFLLVRAYGELRNLPYFDLRLKFFTFLMTLVIFVTLLLTVSKFGIAPSLEDSFVAELSTQGPFLNYVTQFEKLSRYV